jgi:hypothetical protein
VGVFGLFDLCKNLHVGVTLFKVSATHRLNIIQFSVTRLRNSLDVSTHVIQLLLSLLSCALDFTATSLKIILFISDLHDFSGGTLKVLLKLLQLTTLLKESFGGSSTLVLKDLLALKISALSTLHEFISVVLVTNLEVVKSVCECFDFFFALSDLAVELITVSLELFTLLGSLNDEVGLSVLTVSFHISRG